MDALLYLFVWFLGFAITIMVLRWALRVNDVVENLEEIRRLLSRE